MEQLTIIQKQTLKYIQAFITNHGYPPSIQEMADGHDVACNAIQGRIEALHKKGFVNKKHGVARSIVLSDKGRDALN